jgi:hypothetical protein
LNLFNQLGWEDVYRDWESDDLKYYWKNLENPVVPRDLSYLDKGFDEAVDLAKAGDPHARHFLARFLKRDPESSQARIAETVLEEASD